MAQSDGDSERRQTAKSVKYAAANDLELVQSYADLGISGWKGRNHKEGALGLFLEAVDAGTIPPGSVLLVEAFDRLTREGVLDALELLLRITKSEITIVTLFDGATYSRETINNDWTKLIIALAQFSRGNNDVTVKSDRLLESWENRRKNAATKRTTTVSPAWVTPNTSGKFSLNNRAVLVQRIFVELADQNMGATKIATRLNAEGVPSWGPTKKDGRKPSWHASMIKKLVGQRAVLGEFQPHRMVDGTRQPDGPPIPGYYPEAIDIDLYHRAQAAMIRRRNTGAGRKGKAFSNLLTGLVHCDECGSTMVYVNKGEGPKGGQYLTCSAAKRRFRCEATTHHPYKPIEDRFLSVVVGDLELPGDRVDDSRLKAQIAEAKHSIASLNQRIETIGLTLATTFSPTMVTLLKKAEADLVKQTAALEVLEDDLVVLQCKPAPNAHQEAVRGFLGELATADDVYAVRSRLAGVVKAIVDDVVIERNGVVTVIILGGVKAYRWDESGWDMVDITGMVAAGVIPSTNYAGTPDRMQQVRRLAT